MCSLRWVGHTGQIRVAVSYMSAVAEARIGGGLYEVVASPHGVRVIVDDVQGKGLEAVETAAVVLGAFREAAPDEADLAAVGRRLERSVERQMDGEKFVTAILAEVKAEEVTFLNFGHPAPLLIRADGSVTWPEPPVYSLPLGLHAHGTAPPEPYRTDFRPGDQLLLYNDGVTEARDANGRFYPLAERTHLLKEEDAETALETVRQDLLQHVNGPPARRRRHAPPPLPLTRPGTGWEEPMSLQAWARSSASPAVSKPPAWSARAAATKPCLR